MEILVRIRVILRRAQLLKMKNTLSLSGLRKGLKMNIFNVYLVQVLTVFQLLYVRFPEVSQSKNLTIKVEKNLIEY